MVLTIAPEDWRHDILQYLKAPNRSHSQQVRQRAQYYVIRDEVLFRIGSDDLLMKCLGKKEQLVAMTEVHEGVCGAHQAGIKMRWLLRRHGYYWSTILKDCIEYAKGCKDCQKHRPIQHVLAGPMNPIVKAWPFKGWAMDVIGQIHPKSSKGHKYILVATDFFTKNGESKRSATRTTPFALAYGYDVVLPLEISVKSLRVVRHAEWSKDEHEQAIAQELDDLDEVRLGTLDRLWPKKRPWLEHTTREPRPRVLGSEI
ncbi:hypothetical protein L3X38_024498 [Prunus dulcis]|uniref:Integrase zinc-binding domain-containing protein n=1 Tax=Prunus dulcis TaxID=3755 RepID=A0AAD4VZW3_PRUDU|nr:hypothetical protein L3X38_024498 [Prunus dulcis]